MKRKVTQGDRGMRAPKWIFHANLWSTKGVLTFKFWTTNETQDRFEFASIDCLHPWGCGHSFLIPKERCNEGLIYIGLIYWIIKQPNLSSHFNTGLRNFTPRWTI